MKKGRHVPLNARGVAATALATSALLVSGTSVLTAAALSAASTASTASTGSTEQGSIDSAGSTPTPGSTAKSGPAAQLTNSAAPPVGPGAHQGVSASTAGGSVVAASPTLDGRGFWMAWSNGAVTTEGDAIWLGDVAGVHLNGPIIGIAPTPSGLGYWLLGRDGGVFSFGDAGFYGSTGGIRLNAPALQMVSTGNGHGYDFVAGDGGIFTFGNAAFYGSTGAMRLNQPVVGMASTPQGDGYWLVARDGGIFTFGAAGFHGSTGAIRLAAPVVSMARTHDGNGYWLLGQDGGVFTFGDAPFFGAAVGRTGGSPAIAIVATGDGGGYWVVTANGLVVPMGDASFSSGPIAAAIPADNNFAFEVTNSAGAAARWNPCEAVHYSVVYPGAPAGWQNDVSNDIAQVGQATGLSFVNDGTYSSASAVPASSKIVISWVSGLSGGDTIGLTTYSYYNSAPYTPQIVSAQVELLSSLQSGGGMSGEQPVLLHELGHAVGLAHVNAGEVMNPVDQGFSTYQAGDLNGMQRLGSAGGCSGFYG